MTAKFKAITKTGSASIVAAALIISLAGCGGTPDTASASDAETSAVVVSDETNATSTETAASASVATANITTDGAIDATDLFSERDLTQVADLTDAQAITLTSGQDVQITEEGVYVVTGDASDVTIVVDVEDSAKVQLVLDDASITNEDAPAIYVKNADKVFVTTADGSTNKLAVTGTFTADGDTNTDAVIFSKDDLTLNGLGTLEVSSTGNGITSKDDLKVTGGTYTIDAAADALEANDSILVSDGTLGITTSKDGLHAENDEDTTVGYVYICGGSLDIDAADDGIQATTILQIDGGSFSINAAEALEATYVQVNGGSFDIEASDDGINATTKSTSIGTPTIEITGGELGITMGAGDTDALDANGNLVISGGTINISAQSAFDFDGTVTFTGGTVTVNGEQVSEISNSMMMGGGMGGPGGMGGGPGEMGGGPRDMGGDGGFGEAPQGDLQG